jgi:hypothetical protein
MLVYFEESFGMLLTVYTRYHYHFIIEFHYGIIMFNWLKNYIDVEKHATSCLVDLSFNRSQGDAEKGPKPKRVYLSEMNED